MSKLKSIEYYMEQGLQLFLEKLRSEEAATVYERKKSEVYDELNKFFDDNSLSTVDYEYDDKTMDAYGFTKEDDDEPNLALKFTQVVRRSITWDTEKMFSKLPRSIRDEVIISEYKVPDIKALAEYVKELGGDAKTLRSLLTIERKADNKAINRLEETGAINLDMLEGCYTVKESAPYYRVNEIERG